jgi:hypothetical protein
LVARVEDRIASERGLTRGNVLIDFPKKPEMLSVHLPVRTRKGDVVLLGQESGVDWLGIQRVSHELHTSARRLRVFAAAPCEIDAHQLVSLVGRSGPEVAADLEQDRALLTSRS